MLELSQNCWGILEIKLVIVIVYHNSYIFKSFVDFVVAWKNWLYERLYLDVRVVNRLLSFIHITKAAYVRRVPHWAFHVRLTLISVVSQLVSTINADLGQIYRLVYVPSLKKSYKSRPNIFVHLKPICDNSGIQKC